MEWVADDTKGEFNCGYCQENKLQEGRNCDGTNDDGIPFKVYNEVHFRCPIKLVDPDWSDVVSFVCSCEGGGMAVSRVMPSELLNETGFYITARRIIMTEQGRISKWKEKAKKEKHGQA